MPQQHLAAVIKTCVACFPKSFQLSQSFDGTQSGVVVVAS